MRNRLCLALGIAALVPALAQAAPAILVAEIPFEFHVGSALLPAGKYTVDANGEQKVRVESMDRKKVALTWAIPAQSGSHDASSRLVFNRYGDQFFLSRLVIAGSRDGHAIRKSKLERELAKKATQQEIAVSASGGSR